MSSILPPTTVLVSDEDKETIKDWNAQWTQILNGVQDQLASLGCTVRLRFIYKSLNNSSMSTIASARLDITIPPSSIQ